VQRKHGQKQCGSNDLEVQAQENGVMETLLQSIPTMIINRKVLTFQREQYEIGVEMGKGGRAEGYANHVPRLPGIRLGVSQCGRDRALQAASGARSVFPDGIVHLQVPLEASEASRRTQVRIFQRLVTPGYDCRDHTVHVVILECRPG
jgi:hypothetical protein